MREFLHLDLLDGHSVKSSAWGLCNVRYFTKDNNIFAWGSAYGFVFISLLVVGLSRLNTALLAQICYCHSWIQTLIWKVNICKFKCNGAKNLYWYGFQQKLIDDNWTPRPQSESYSLLIIRSSKYGRWEGRGEYSLGVSQTKYPAFMVSSFS